MIAIITVDGRLLLLFGDILLVYQLPPYILFEVAQVLLRFPIQGSIAASFLLRLFQLLCGGFWDLSLSLLLLLYLLILLLELFNVVITLLVYVSLLFECFSHLVLPRLLHQFGAGALLLLAAAILTGILNSWFLANFILPHNDEVFFLLLFSLRVIFFLLPVCGELHLCLLSSLSDAVGEASHPLHRLLDLRANLAHLDHPGATLLVPLLEVPL